MRCFKCNEVLTKESHCPNCGIDVSMYKKAVMASNAYYNLGLSKAKVRDLSGAVESLKMSITINKKNIKIIGTIVGIIAIIIIGVYIYIIR